MTINEIEARTGLDRGTVRYYEQEGLIKPAREANGYRNYSEADLKKLQKVKLLRALGFSVDDIRAMDADAGDFQQRLRARARSLEARQEDLEDRKRVLERMISDGAAYETLNAGMYLAMESPHPRLKPGPVRRDAPGPWRRYFARLLDFSLLGLVFYAVAVLLFHAPVRLKLPWVLAETAATGLALLFLEPLCLALFGATPGKALLGIRVLDARGECLSYRAALRRTWGVLLWGMGLRIPLVSTVFLVGCYLDARRGTRMIWERDSSIELVSDGLGLNLAYGMALTAVVVAQLFIYGLSLLPPNRGELTPEELAENVNRRFLLMSEVSDYPDLFDPGLRLRPDGLWDDEEHKALGFAPARVEITVENGAVTGLRWVQRVKTSLEQSHCGALDDLVSALVWGFVGSDRDLGLMDLRSLLGDADFAGFHEFALCPEGWTVECHALMSDGAVVSAGAAQFPSGGGEYGVELVISRGETP